MSYILQYDPVTGHHDQIDIPGDDFGEDGAPGPEGPAGPEGPEGPAGPVGMVPSGTSFPGSPEEGDEFFRTDRGLLYFYDGAHWLTVQLYHDALAQGATNIGAVQDPPWSNSFGFVWSVPSWRDLYDMYLEDFTGTTFCGTLSGSAYWTFTLGGRTPANTTTPLASFDSSADTSGVWTKHRTAINALLTSFGAGNFPVLELGGVKTGSPQPTYCFPAVTYRLVG